jgi:thiol-disulfide isomerase/thioredoxin
MPLKNALCIALLCLMPAAAAYKVTPRVQNGEAAPVFMLPTLSSERLSLRDFCGKLRNPWKNKKKHIVVLSFMASYCVPCRHEIPQLEAFASEAPDDVRVLYISVDTLGKAVLVPFKNQMKIARPVLHDRYGQVMKKYGVKKLPSLFIIGKDGRIFFQSLNGLPPNLDLKKMLKEKVLALRGKPSPGPGAKKARGGQGPNVSPEVKVAALQGLFSGKSTKQVLAETRLTREDLLRLEKEVIAIVKDAWK